jgi:hypothetical protein
VSLDLAAHGLRPGTADCGDRLRIGALRVYYDVEEEPDRKVLVRAIGTKRRKRVRIGRKEFEI